MHVITCKGSKRIFLDALHALHGTCKTGEPCVFEVVEHMHSWQYSTWSKDLISTLYTVPSLRQVLASKGGIADPDQPCYSTLVGSTPSSSSSQLVGQQLSCLKPGSRVHQAESTDTWIPWALLWLILEVLVPCKLECQSGQLALDTCCERDVEYYLLVPIFWPRLVRSAVQCPFEKMD